MAEQQGNSSFAKAFLPGLVIGLIIGGTVGALWVPMLEAKNSGTDVSPQQGTSKKASAPNQAERPAPNRPEGAPLEPAKADESDASTKKESEKKDEEKKPEGPSKAPPK